MISRIATVVQQGNHTGTIGFDSTAIRDSQVMRYIVTDYLDDHRGEDYSISFRAYSTPAELAGVDVIVEATSSDYDARLFATIR